MTWVPDSANAAMIGARRGRFPATAAAAWAAPSALHSVPVTVAALARPGDGHRDSISHDSTTCRLVPKLFALLELDRLSLGRHRRAVAEHSPTVTDMAASRTLTIPPRVPRWQELERTEYSLLSSEGYPMPVRGKCLPEDSTHVLKQFRDDVSFFDGDMFGNSFPQSSKGMISREFNQPFPKAKHRFCNGKTLQNGKVITNMSPNVGTSKFPTRTTVPGLLWPAMRTDLKRLSSMQTTEGAVHQNRPTQEQREIPHKLESEPLDFNTRQFQDFRPSSALALTNSSHGMLLSTLYPRSRTPYFVAIKPTKVKSSKRSHSVPLADRPQVYVSVPPSEHNTQSPSIKASHTAPQEPPRDPEDEASAAVSKQPPYVRSRAWVSSLKFTGRRWTDLR